MFRDTKAFSSFAVDDVDAARAFYGETLGVKITAADEAGLLILDIAGERPTLVYPKPGHTPADYTVLNFQVDDIDAAVDGLVERGIEFLRYDDFDQDEKGVMRHAGPSIAWFKDPAGNVLSVIEGNV